jgi:Nucleoside-diphosphate-sugar epimerases
MVEALLEAGAKVRAFCYYNSFNSFGWLDSLPRAKTSRIEICMGDVRDPYGVRSAIKGMDMVFHLAALIGIPYSYSSPDSYVDTNIKGTLNVLQAARECSTKRILITSTSEVYGTALYAPIDEKHPFQAQSPYSATKIGADRLAESFYRSFNMPVTIIRPFNTYGPRQSARAIIPTIISQIASGSTELKIGDLRPSRDFNYISDTCSGFLNIAGTDKTIGEEINIASGKDISVGKLVESIIKLMKPSKKVRVVLDESRKRPSNSEVMRLVGSNEKLKQLTGWEPKYSLEAGLAETIGWFKKNMKNINRIYTMSKSANIPLSVPLLHGNEWRYLKGCLDSSWISSKGKYIDMFEKRIARYLSAPHAVSCVNGTSALHICLLLAGVHSGDEVIVPTVTFIAPVNAVRYARANPVFMDCDDHLNIDIEKLRNF